MMGGMGGKGGKIEDIFYRRLCEKLFIRPGQQGKAQHGSWLLATYLPPYTFSNLGVSPGQLESWPWMFHFSLLFEAGEYSRAATWRKDS